MQKRTDKQLADLILLYNFCVRALCPRAEPRDTPHCPSGASYAPIAAGVREPPRAQERLALHADRFGTV